MPQPISVSATTDDGGPHLIASTPRLSLLSTHAKHAVSLNQIDHVEIRSSYEREEDGVTIYVVDVYVRCAQSGIPFKPSSSCVNHPKQPLSTRTTRTHSHRSSDGEGAHPQSHYRMEYRYSDFRHLRRDLQRAMSAQEDPAHRKWCNYCSRLEDIVHFVRFPSRWLLVDPVCSRLRWLRGVRAATRRSTLAFFLNRLIRGAKDATYRYGGEPCEGFVEASFLIKEFLCEPSVRESCVGW